MTRVIWAACLLLLVSSVARAAEPPTDVALVLVTDVSRSIDDTEYQLEKQGYATAFTDPRVIAAIQGGPLGRITVAYIEFSGPEQVRALLPWTVISNAGQARAFADSLVALPRSSYGRTAISSGIDLATEMLADPGFAEARRVIDVAGDGTNNAGRPITEARDAAVAAGIAINGLTIINDHPVSYTFAHVQPPGGLTRWYSDNVTGGPGSFVLEVHDFSTFGAAMARKLLSEIAVQDPAPGRRRG